MVLLNVDSSHEKSPPTQQTWFKNKKTVNEQPQLAQFYQNGGRHSKPYPPKKMWFYLGFTPKTLATGELAVNDSGKMAMGQGFAQRQRSGVRGCLRVSNVAPRPGRHWNWVPGVVDGLGRDGSHLHFGGFLGSLAIGTPVTKVSRSLQYWLIKAFVQLWLLVLEATRLSSVFMSLGPVFKLLCHIQPLLMVDIFLGPWGALRGW